MSSQDPDDGRTDPGGHEAPAPASPPRDTVAPDPGGATAPAAGGPPPPGSRPAGTAPSPGAAPPGAPPRPPARPRPPVGPAQRDSLGHFFVKVLIATVTIPVVLGGLLLLLLLTIAAAVGQQEPDRLLTTHVDGPVDSAEALLVVPVEGIILGEEDPTQIFAVGAVTNGYAVKEALIRAASEERIAGVVLEIQSPGGTIYGSRAIADGVREVTAAGKPVTAFVRGLSASGAVYASAPAQRVWADHGSQIGSIGVISGPFTFYDQPTAIDGGVLTGGVVTENGVEQRYISAGEGKDLGNPFRRLTPREVEVLQGGVDDNYDEFVSFVEEHRDIPRERIVDELGALIYSNEQSEQAGLIDGTLNRDQARDETAKLADLPADYEIVTLQQAPGLLGLLRARVLEPDPAPAAATGCPLAAQVLAYHGDPAQLCAPGIAGG
ncbi:MAG TPA: S49 family peptidase [Euzebyales bacterium]|nr:S49 family peptidase [Euzebyales bacterium]